MRQNAAIPPDGAYREPSAHTDCAKTASKSSNTQSKHLANQQEYYASASVLLRKGAFNVSRVQSALSQASFSVCPRPRHSFAFAQTKTSFRTYPYPKHPFDLGCTQGAPSCSPESKAGLRDHLNPRLPFAITCAQTAPLSLPAPKAALCTCPHPRPTFTITCIQSPSC